MAKRQTAMQGAPADTEFSDIVMRSMPTAIDANLVLTGMAMRALNKGMLTATSFDEALMHVFKEGIRLGREGAPKRAKRAGRLRQINGVPPMSAEEEQFHRDQGTITGSSLGSARGE